MTESVLLVLVSFGFGFMAGALCGTLFIGWMAWRAVSGLASMGAHIRESQKEGVPPFQKWGSPHPEA
jgi:hypothetical protein